MKLMLKGEVLRECSVGTALCGIGFDQIIFDAKDFECIHSAPPEMIMEYFHNTLATTVA